MIDMYNAHAIIYSANDKSYLRLDSEWYVFDPFEHSFKYLINPALIDYLEDMYLENKS